MELRKERYQVTNWTIIAGLKRYCSTGSFQKSQSTGTRLEVRDYLRTHLDIHGEQTAPLNRARVSEVEYANEMANDNTEMRLASEPGNEHTSVLRWTHLNRPLQLATAANTEIGREEVQYQPILEQQ